MCSPLYLNLLHCPQTLRYRIRDTRLTSIYHRDLGISKLTGLPRVVRHGQTDVADPRNLLDSDFDENSSELPPSRPETQFTPSLYARARLRLARSVWIKVTDLATQPQPPLYSEILVVHNKIDSARADIPLCLKWRGLSNSLAVQARMLIKQIFLETSILSMKILLHKRFMVASQHQPQHSFSRSSCVSAAIEILKLQHLVDDETQLDGRLYQSRWSIITTFIHDFLLATGVLCFYVQTHGQGSHHQNIDSPGDLTCAEIPDIEKVKDILKATLVIWVRDSATSREAETAATAIRYILSKDDTNLDPDIPSADVTLDSKEVNMSGK